MVSGGLEAVSVLGESLRSLSLVYPLQVIKAGKSYKKSISLFIIIYIIIQTGMHTWYLKLVSLSCSIIIPDVRTKTARIDSDLNILDSVCASEWSGAEHLAF